jgi:tRNA uridine 5-carboxymethylaminomethyl modification enzyme
MAKAADEAGIQFRVLNRSKGPAVHGPRVQADRVKYRESIVRQLQATPNLSILEGSADEFIRNENGDVRGVVLADGTRLSSAAVILATGTFLGGRIHLGKVCCAVCRMSVCETHVPFAGELAVRSYG